jgi:hypothetical protein
MLSTEMEYPCTRLKCFLEGWNAFNRVGIPLYRVGMLSTGLECFLQGWNAFGRVGMLSTEVECFRQCWNAFYRVGMLWTVLEIVLQSWKGFGHVEVIDTSRKTLHVVFSFLRRRGHQ